MKLNLEYKENEISSSPDFNLEYGNDEISSIPNLNTNYESSDITSSPDLNLEYEPITEASIGGGGGVGGFIGKGGQDIDDIFAGGFLATDNLLIDLQQQLVDAIEHRVFSDENTPEQEKDWLQLKTNLRIDDYVKELNIDNFKNDSNQMKQIDMDLIVDDFIKQMDFEKYKNETNKMKNIDLSYIYDREEKRDMSGFTNDSDDWKTIPNFQDIYDKDIIGGYK